MSERKLIEVAKKRVPMKKIFHNKEIRDGMAELEKFRQQFNEQEFFYGAKVYLEVGNYGETTAVVKRLETDKEYNARLDEERKKAEEKLARAEARRVREEHKRKKAEEAEARRIEEQRLKEVEYVKTMARKLGITAKELGVE